MKKSTAAGENAFSLRPPLLSGLAGLVITLVLLMVSALLISKMIIPENSSEAAGEICLCLGAFAGGVLATAKSSSGRFLAVLAADGLEVFAVMLLAAFSRDCNVFTLKMLVNLAVILLASFLGCIVALKIRSKGRRRRRR